jgi:hypothetical protein
LLNLYTFNLSKEIFQVCIFLIVYWILQSEKGAISKVILSTVVLFLWGLIFRIYYCLIAAYAAMVYILLQCFFRQKRLFSMIALILSGLLISLVLIQFITPENYNAMWMVRSGVNKFREGSPDSETIIFDIIRNNGDPLIFFVNIFLSIVRLMLPVELLLIGVNLRYCLFIAYHFITTTYYLKTVGTVLRKEADETQKIAFCVFTGFLLGSGLFEPDFGSWIRHESASLPVLLLMFFKRKKILKQGAF